MEVEIEKVINKLLQKIANLELENAKLTVAVEEKYVTNDGQDDQK